MAGLKHGSHLSALRADNSKRANLPLSTSNNPLEVPLCLRRLIRTVLKTFYTTEHGIVMNILLRNSIMKEDDLCERLRFDRKFLRQLLHTLKTDQFIKSRMQLETEAEGKTNRITHYFIDFKVFVNVVKYRLDMMHRRLEGEQRDSSSRANYKCIGCDTTYTDLEIDRLVEPMSGSLICSFCKAEVHEQEDSINRAGACAKVIAKFNQQIRKPIDELLRECEQVHLSTAILEPEIRPLEPMPESEFGKTENNSSTKTFDEEKDKKWQATLDKEQEARSMIRVVVDDNDKYNQKTVKERPVWLRESTVHLPSLVDSYNKYVPTNGHAKLDSSNTNHDRSLSESTVQTLTPGRIPQHFLNGSSSEIGGSNGIGQMGTQIMELLMIHEKRRSSLGTNSTENPKQSQSEPAQNGSSQDSHYIPPEFTIRLLNGSLLDYRNITASQLKKFGDQELLEFRRVGRLLYSKRVFE